MQGYFVTIQAGVFHEQFFRRINYRQLYRNSPHSLGADDRLRHKRARERPKGSSAEPEGFSGRTSSSGSVRGLLHARSREECIACTLTLGSVDRQTRGLETGHSGCGPCRHAASLVLAPQWLILREWPGQPLGPGALRFGDSRRKHRCGGESVVQAMDYHHRSRSILNTEVVPAGGIEPTA